MTLVSEVRLWYESLRLIAVVWYGLQAQFREQYSMIGSTREQYFPFLELFHFDENTETKLNQETAMIHT